MTDDRADPAASVNLTAAKRGGLESRSAPAVEQDHRQKVIKSLLANTGQTVDEKLATVKTAHHVDRDRFQNAFRSLMGR